MDDMQVYIANLGKYNEGELVARNSQECNKYNVEKEI